MPPTGDLMHMGTSIEILPIIIAVIIGLAIMGFTLEKLN